MELQFQLIFTSVILFLFMVVIGFGSKFHKKSSKLPPSPWKLPIIGHLHHLLGDLPHRSLKNLAKKHGPLMLLQLGQVPTIIVSSPRIAKEILKDNGMVFADRNPFYAGNILTYGGIGIVLSPYGGHWRQLRKICILELFSAKKVQSFLSVREEEVANLIENILSMAGCSVNLSQKIFSLINDITCRAAFGEKCKNKDVFLTLMKEVLELSSSFQTADFFPSLKFLPVITGVKRRLEKLHQKIDKVLDDIINEHRQYRKEGKLHEDLIDVLLRLQNDNTLEFPLQNDCIKAVIFEIFIAGTETSSITLQWAFSELLKNPRIMEKSQSEVRQVLQEKGKGGQSKTHHFKYLSLVIKETLRLHPPIPLLLPRESRERCKIDGYEISNGTNVFVNAWALGRDPEYWSDAETFKPERFQDLSIDYKGTNFEFIPFGAGKRICPGMSFGIASIQLPLAQLLYHFNWKLSNGKNPEEVDMTELFEGSLGRKSNLYLIPTPYLP